MRNYEFIRDLDKVRGTQKLWRFDDYYAVTSAIDNEFGQETYVFEADEHGEIINWTELPGSEKGTQDHDAVIAAHASGSRGWTE